MSRPQILIALLVGILAVWIYTAWPPPSASDGPAPDLAVQIDGKKVRLDDLKGKVVLIDFWATWCGPCRESIPEIQDLYTRYHQKGFEVLGVALEEDNGENIPAFVKAMGMTYLVGMPVSKQSVRTSFHISGIPQMVLVDRRGVIRWRPEPGYAPSMDSQIAAQVESLLKE